MLWKCINESKIIILYSKKFLLSYKLFDWAALNANIHLKFAEFA